VLQREACLRPAYARLYPGVQANTWLPAQQVAEVVRWQLAQLAPHLKRVLSDTHFNFRGGVARASWVHTRAGDPTSRTESRERRRFSRRSRPGSDA